MAGQSGLACFVVEAGQLQTLTWSTVTDLFRGR
jgi:hypothetical protein